MCGTAYELFEESIYDVDLWIKKAKELGYKNYHSIKQIERGVNTYTFHKLMEIAKKHNLIITIEKK